MKYLPVLFLILFLCCSCNVEQAGRLTAIELEKIITENQYQEEDFSEARISELDPDASYYLALKALSLGYEKTALLLSRYSWQNSIGLLREKAAELCVLTSAGMNRWADAGFSASLAAAEYPDNYFFRRTAAASAYWQRKDTELPEKIGRLKKYAESSEDWELFLFSAVSAYRIGESGWEEEWVLMFENVPSSEYIRRGWDYLTAEHDEPYLLFPGFENLIEGKYLFSVGNYREAGVFLSAWLESSVKGNPEGKYSRTAASDLEELFIRQGTTAKGGKFFEDLAASAAEGAESDYYRFAAARMYRRGGWYGNAERCLDEIIQASGPDVSDRILWYSLDIAEKRDPAEAARRLPFYIEHWDDPDYFADVLDELCTGLVRSRKWKEIASVSDLLRQSGPKDVGDRYIYLARRAADEGFLRGEPREGRTYTDLYYRILTGDSLPELAVKTSEPAIPVDREMNQAELYVYGLIKWNLDEMLLDAIKQHKDELSESFLRYCASEAVGRLAHLDSIRMMYQYQGQLSAGGLLSLYPDIYREEVEYAAALNDIPPQVLFGLVWKESGFEREIVSRSGAVGLSQLMPSTAEDVAIRMKRDIPDLTDPAENLLTGSWYLNWLNGYVGNKAAAVISYNGGPGRVRRWMREYPDFPPDLLFEAVPVKETHDYGKRVLTASVLYGLLYYEIKPAESLSLFFPVLSGRG
ncbi:MAG: lytic transglycosylase domain-containing protein [Spirochaetales bacterium]|nr:lytic transglycosylase domain-containing protein [Spirochaetales bacterium]